MSRDSGFSIVEILIALAITAIGALAVSSAFKLQTNVQDSAALRSTGLGLKTVLLGPLSCNKTMFPAGLAEACANTAAATADCDDAALDAPPKRWLDLKRGDGSTYASGAPTKRGAVETRICCPGGNLRAEWRIVKGSGEPKADPLNGNLTYDWRPTFRVASPCSSVAATGVKRSVVYGNVTPTGYQCPGYFPENAVALFGYAMVAEGTATCPAGKKLVGGGVNCPFVPFQGVVAARPYAPSSTDPAQYADTTRTYFGSCCGLPALTYSDAVYAICE